MPTNGHGGRPAEERAAATRGESVRDQRRERGCGRPGERREQRPTEDWDTELSEEREEGSEKGRDGESERQRKRERERERERREMK